MFIKASWIYKQQDSFNKDNLRGNRREQQKVKGVRKTVNISHEDPFSPEVFLAWNQDGDGQPARATGNMAYVKQAESF